MTELDDLAASIAATAADYRKPDGEAPDIRRVKRWVGQFEPAVRVPILREMDHVLKRTYFSRPRTVEFLKGLLRAEKLVGSDPCAFWKDVKFLDIQQGGASQTQMLALLGKILKSQCGLEISKCGKNASTFVYIDDATFSGNRVKGDLEKWICTSAPAKATVHIIMIAIHAGAVYYAENHSKNNILKAAKEAGKNIEFHWWSELTLENRKMHADVSDVLWPVRIPDKQEVTDYVDAMKYKPSLRPPGHIGANAVFSSDENRQLLEEEFLKAGVHIRQVCPLLKVYHRPLGNSLLETLGFGSLIVTFRNCANNVPLALWAGDPWIPLFPRTTNSDTSTRKFLEMLASEGA